MKMRRGWTGTACCGAAMFLVAAQIRTAADTASSPVTPALGSPDFRASPERPIGWRGDGTGRYPGATPPLHWSRVATSVKSLRAQATKPKEGDTGTPIDGTIREWLILGPVPFTNKIDKSKDVLPDEATLDPSEGDKVGDLTWKRVSSESQTLNFRELLSVEKETQAVAYASTRIYSETAQSFRLNIMSSGHRVLVNGAIPKEDPYVLPSYLGEVLVLEKGWNRIVFRVPAGKLDGYPPSPEPKWFLRIILYGAGGTKVATAYSETPCESENIVWRTGLGKGLSIPVIVGDKIFLTTERSRLWCLNKTDGKVLWIRTLTLFDVATDEEKKANPEVFQEIAPLAAKLAEVDRSLGGGGGDIENKICSLMAKVDRQKYAPLPGSGGEGGVSAPTAVSDGQSVYVAFHPYLVACFDLDGNRRWLYMHPGTPAGEHGDYSSPSLVDDKLVVYSDRLFAVDAKTGKQLWQKPSADDPNEKANTDSHQCYSVLGTTIGSEPMVVTAPNVYRARDGKLLSFFKLTNFGSCIATPVIADGRIFRIWTTGGPGKTTLETICLPAVPDEPFQAEMKKGAVIDANRFHRWYCGWYTASPLYHEGLVYCLSEDGVLNVVDAEKQEIVYQRQLDLDLEMVHGGMARGGACSSPALAGKYIYIFGNHGAGVVIEPGRSFRQVARNRIENGTMYPHVTASCPVFEGTRLYLRTSDSLYCIGAEEDVRAGGQR